MQFWCADALKESATDSPVRLRSYEFVLFGTHNRIFGPYLVDIHRNLIPDSPWLRFASVSCVLVSFPNMVLPVMSALKK
jgi:hypothetical protein